MSDEPALEADPSQEKPNGPGWFRWLSSVLFIMFAIELGLFLVVYPWLPAWSENYLVTAVPDTVLGGWRELWNNPFVRGGVSGLGLVNIWIAIGEVFRMFSQRDR
jgi:hypothetical protein